MACEKNELILVNWVDCCCGEGKGSCSVLGCATPELSFTAWKAALGRTPPRPARTRLREVTLRWRVSGCSLPAGVCKLVNILSSRTSVWVGGGGGALNVLL